MTQCTRLIQCMICGSECVLSFEPEFGSPIFCPFCSEEIIDEEDLYEDLDDEDESDDDEDDYDEDPINEHIMNVNLY